MRKLAVALAVFVSLTSSAFAAEGPLMIRFRGVYVAPANQSKAFDVPGALTLPKNQVEISQKTIPEVDFSWFFTPNLSAELILTFPQQMNVKVKSATVGGNAVKDVDFGTVTILPPCLTAQWHFLPDFYLNPYVGVGANLTLVTAQDLALDTHIKPSNSFGFVGQVGADVKITDHVYLNLDVKYVTMAFDVKARSDGTKITTVTVNPMLYALGLGYRY